DWLSAVYLWVTVTQWGLGAHERYLNGEGDDWLEAAAACGSYLLAHQDEDGAFRHTQPYPHTFDLRPPRVSGIAQGQAASLFVRLFVATGDSVFDAGARSALAPFSVPSGEGGILATLEGRAWPEEYPTSPPSYVLNGGIFGMWGYRDVAVALGDSTA